jgi:hypothetical protein
VLRWGDAPKKRTPGVRALDPLGTCAFVSEVVEPGSGGVEFEVLLPIGGGSAPEAVAHMHGDEATFLEALGDVMRSNRSEAALLARPIPTSLSGLQTEDVQAVLDSLGGAVVRGIVPLPQGDDHAPPAG